MAQATIPARGTSTFHLGWLGVAVLVVIVAVVAGLVGYALAPRWWLFFPMASIIGLGSGAIDSGLNSYAARHFPVSHVNWLHASWSLGATAGPAMMTAVLARGARTGSWHFPTASAFSGSRYFFALESRSLIKASSCPAMAAICSAVLA